MSLPALICNVKRIDTPIAATTAPRHHSPTLKKGGRGGICRTSLHKALLAISLLAALPAQAADTIAFWTIGMKPKFTDYFTNLANQYQQQNPGIKIEWQDYPGEVIQTKLAASIAARNPPALVNLNVPWAEEYARDGLIQPVDALLANKNQYAPGPLADLTFNGKLYGFPHYENLSVIVYNKAILQQAGLAKPPASLDEELQWATQIAAKTGKAGFAPALGKIDGLFLHQGLPLLNGKQAVFNSPKHVELITKLAAAYAAKALLRDKLFAEDNFPAAIEAYKGGRLAMLVSAPSVLTRIETDAKDIYALSEVAPAPLGANGVPDGCWLFHFAIPSGVPAARLPATAKFAQFLTNDANQLAFAKLAGVFPSSQNASKDPAFTTLSKNPGLTERAQVMAARGLPQARSLYVTGILDYDALRKILVQAVEAAVTGKKEPKLALDEAVAVWNKKLVSRK